MSKNFVVAMLVGGHLTRTPNGEMVTSRYNVLYLTRDHLGDHWSDKKRGAMRFTEKKAMARVDETIKTVWSKRSSRTARKAVGAFDQSETAVHVAVTLARK